MAAFALMVASTTIARAETLTDALVSAYKNSGLLEQNRALLRAADEDVAQAVARLRPVLNYTLNAQHRNATIEVSPGVTAVTSATTSNLQLTGSMVLYDFGRSDFGVEIAKENVLSMRDALVGVEQRVLLGAVSAFVNVQRDISILGLRENNVRLISEQLRAANDRYEVGEITRTDVSIATARLASAKSLLAAAAGNLAISKEEYRAAVGRYPGQLAALPRVPATSRSLTDARAVARQNHPDISQAQHSVRVADLNVGIAAAGIMPTLSGSAVLGIDQDGRDSASIGLSLSGPIYQGGQLASVHRKAVAQRDATRAALHLASIGIEQNVGVAWARLGVSDAGLSASEEQIRAARVAFRGVSEEANLGARTTLDVLNAEQELLDAQAGQISAQSDRYLAVYSLLSATGLLTANHLGLGITTYDPAAYYNAVKSAPSYGVSDQGQRLDSLLQRIGKSN